MRPPSFLQHVFVIPMHRREVRAGESHSWLPACRAPHVMQSTLQLVHSFFIRAAHTVPIERVMIHETIKLHGSCEEECQCKSYTKRIASEEAGSRTPAVRATHIITQYSGRSHKHWKGETCEILCGHSAKTSKSTTYTNAEYPGAVHAPGTLRLPLPRCFCRPSIGKEKKQGSSTSP